jgi:predicted DsbA family dithiol-disulfide isomerase
MTLLHTSTVDCDSLTSRAFLRSARALALANSTVILEAVATRATFRDPTVTDSPKMIVEIWSDVICPFCYIGKRKFETALAQLPQRDRIEVVWKSFQLQPDTRTDPSRNAVQHAAERKGWTLEFTRQAMADVTERARQVGLSFHYEQTVVANTFDAHRLAHYATAAGKGDEMHEQLFKAYFTDGRNIADHAVLVTLASPVGLSEDAVKRVLDSDQFAAEVRRDIDEALRFGINAVPCFVFDRKYAVSGAQDPAILLQALQQSLAERADASHSPSLAATSGPACDPQGNCDQ